MPPWLVSPRNFILKKINLQYFLGIQTRFLSLFRMLESYKNKEKEKARVDEIFECYTKE